MRHLHFVLVAAVGLAGCSSSAPPVTETDPVDASGQQDRTETEIEAEPESEPEPEPEPEPQPEPDAHEAALAYFEAFATSRSSTMTEMLEHAAEGSPAAVYAQVQIAHTAASEQEGFGFDAQDLTVTDSGVELCGEDMDLQRSCAAFESLAVSDGKLTTFTVDGTQIDDRLFEGGTTVEQSGITVENLGAYHSVQADALIVGLDVNNGADEGTSLDIFSAEYVTSDNRQVSVSDAVGPIELRAGASGYVVLVFPSQGVGGTVFMTGSSEDFMTNHEWELPLRRLD